MADRYWVGGTGTWNTTSTTNWSTTPGGGSGASVPTVADNVFFDQAGTYTVTMTGALGCLSWTVSAGVVTFAPTVGSSSITVNQNVTWAAGTVTAFSGVFSGVFALSSSGSSTISTGGVNVPGNPVTINIGTKNLGSAFSCGNITFSSAGILNTNGFSLTSAGLFGFGTINLSSSTFTCGGANVIASANVTFNAGTSQINCTAASSRLVGAGISSGYTFHNVAFTSTATGTRTITNQNTFNNLSISGPITSGLVLVNIDASQTINGVLSTSGTAGNARVALTNLNYGLSVSLSVNSTSSLSDIDFRGIYVTGAAAPLSGTRLGNRGQCTGITFSPSKTVYWNLAGAQSVSANGWAATPAGTPSTDFFPLPQDIATFTNAGSVTGTISLDNVIPYIGSVDMSTRTTPMTLGLSGSGYTCYGNWTNSSSTAFSGSNSLTFSGESTHTIISAGRLWSRALLVDTFGGTILLGDALTTGNAGSLRVDNGTFDTAGYAFSAGGFSSSPTVVSSRAIYFRSSTVTIQTAFSSSFFGMVTEGLTFDAGTSTVNLSAQTSTSTVGIPAGVTFYNLILSLGASVQVTTVTNRLTVTNNFTITPPVSASIREMILGGNITVGNVFTCAGATLIRRVFLRASSNSTVSITAGSIVGDNADYLAITILGTAAGTSLVGAGDCGGNSGLVFPSPKTVYWNTATTSAWSGTGWAASSGGSPAAGNFPLAQDTAVFDNASALASETISTGGWCIGTFDASARTTAMTVSIGTSTPFVFRDWLYGTGVTHNAGAGLVTFGRPGSQTLTCNGVAFNNPITQSLNAGVLSLGSALLMGSTNVLTIFGQFNAGTYNLTLGLFSFASVATSSFVDMGTGTWTLTGTGQLWFSANQRVIANTSTVVLANTSTTTRVFDNTAVNVYFNKITIGSPGGASGAAVHFLGSINIGELASTKTVAHSVRFASGQSYSIGKWTVTGTVGNVVTVAPVTGTTTFNLRIAGPRTTGLDYLNISYCTVDGTFGSETVGEFYAGPNSTTLSSTGVIVAAPPAPRTLFWVGGTGNWNNTARWSTSSGGGGGAAIPTSADSVTFDSASGTASYTVTLNVFARCGALTFNAPASGTATLSFSSALAVNGNVSFAATGVATTNNGRLMLGGDSSYTLSTNDIDISTDIQLLGIGSVWSLGSALRSTGQRFSLVFGELNTSASNHPITFNRFSADGRGKKTLSLNASTVTITGASSANFSLENNVNLTFNAGTSQVTLANNGSQAGILATYPVTFNNVTAGPMQVLLTGTFTFNNLTIPNRGALGIYSMILSGDITVNGTLTLGSSPIASSRWFVQSDTDGVIRTLTVASLAAGATDVDFRDIAVTGAAAPLSGTRFGDCGDNSGITFPAAKTVYYRQTGSSSWGATGTGSWSATSGGALDATQFPLAQDTAVFPAATYPAFGATTTINASYNIGTIDMSLRTTNTMTLAVTASVSPVVYGNWINGTGTSIGGSTATVTFGGSGAQSLTPQGKIFNFAIIVNSNTGTLTLQGAFSTSITTSGPAPLSIVSGTFDANGYNVTFANTINSNAGVISSGTRPRTIAVGSGTWTFGCAGGFWAMSGSNLTITGTGTIAANNSSPKTFSGNSLDYSGITLAQTGAGALSISGNNTFKEISAPYLVTGATSVNFGSAVTTVQDWNVAGSAGKVFSINGGGSTTPGLLILTGALAFFTVDYINVNAMRASPALNTWKIGTNSTNIGSGSFGFLFQANGGTVYNVTISETSEATDALLAAVIFLSALQESSQAQDVVASTQTFPASVDDSAQLNESVEAQQGFSSQALEEAQAADELSAQPVFLASMDETTQAADTVETAADMLVVVDELAQASDVADSQMDMLSSVDEAAQADDSSVASTDFYALLFEDGQISDQASVTAEFGTSVDEASQTSESVEAQAELNAAASEDAQALDDVSAQADLLADASESAQALDTTDAQLDMFPSVDEAAQGDDSTSATAKFGVLVSEDGQALDEVTAVAAFGAEASETASALDQASALADLGSAVSEDAQISDASNGAADFGSDVSETNNASDSFFGSGVFQTDITDTAQVSDENSSQAVFSPALLETAQALDQTSASAVFRPRIIERARPQDQVLVAASIFGASTSDTANASDTINSQAVFPSDVNETTASSDSASAAQLFVTTLVESSQILDNVSASQGFASRVSETVTALDQVVVAASVFGASTAETVRASDQANSLVTVFGSISEASSAFDATVGFLVFPASVFETAQVLDQITGQILFQASLSEQVNVSDALSPQKVSDANTSESAVISDQAVVGPSVFGAATAEFGQVTDQFQAQAEFGGLVSEASRASDSTAAAMIALGNVAEAAQAIEAFLSNQTFAANTDETVSAADVLQALATFQAVANEAGQVSGQTSTVVVFVGSVAEEVSVSDLAIVAASIFNAALQDDARARDTVDAPGSVYNPAVADTAQAQDSASPAVIMSPAVDESSQVSEQANAVFIAVGQVNESATAVDVAAALAAFVARTEDNASAADINLVAPSIFNAIALAAAQVADNADAPGSVFNVSMTESVILLDSLIGGFLWNLIDDSQDANWQNVPAVQVADWVQVDDTQTTNWQNVPSSQVAGWVEIDTENVPNWQQEPPP